MDDIHVVAVVLVLLMMRPANGLSCYSCSSSRSNDQCNRQVLQCSNTQRACVLSYAVQGTGHFRSLSKSCTTSCSSRISGTKCRSSAGGGGPKSCTYCCTDDLCNKNIATPSLSDFNTTVTNTTNKNATTATSHAVIPTASHSTTTISLTDTTATKNVTNTPKVDVVFSVRKTNVSNHGDDANLHVNFMDYITNTGGGLKDVKGITQFVAPVAGHYAFHVTSRAERGNVSTAFVLLKQDVIVMRVGDKPDSSTPQPSPVATNHVALLLMKGDIIRLLIEPIGSTTIGMLSSSSEVTFTGYLITTSA